MRKKNKVAIITIHCIPNYGSLLQAFALQKTIIEHGYECFTIDYIPDRLKFINLILGTKAKYPKRIFVIVWRLFRHLISGIAVRRYLKKNLFLSSRKYYSNEELREKCPQADVFVTGSDQVWNSKHNNGIDKAYYLDFVPKGKVKLSYAASFGREIYGEEKYLVEKMLESFDGVSVREKTDVKNIGSIVKNGLNVNLDPVFLFSKEKWVDFFERKGAKIQNDRYVIIYEVNNENNERLISLARKVAISGGYKIYFIKTTQRKVDFNGIDKVITTYDPLKFLSLIYHSEYVVTGSFHGTAFSIIFEKEFSVILPRLYENRIISLLSELDLLNRIVYNEEEFILCSVRINYSVVADKIEGLKKSSKNYLLNLIDKTKKQC